MKSGASPSPTRWKLLTNVSVRGRLSVHGDFVRHPRNEIFGARVYAGCCHILRVDLENCLNVSRAGDRAVHREVKPARSHNDLVTAFACTLDFERYHFVCCERGRTLVAGKSECACRSQIIARVSLTAADPVSATNATPANVPIRFIAMTVSLTGWIRQPRSPLSTWRHEQSARSGATTRSVLWQPGAPSDPSPIHIRPSSRRLRIAYGEAS